MTTTARDVASELAAVVGRDHVLAGDIAKRAAAKAETEAAKTAPTAQKISEISGKSPAGADPAGRSHRSPLLYRSTIA